MKKVIRELEKLEESFLELRDQAEEKEKYYKDVDVRSEGKMAGFKLAYTLAAWEIQQVLESLQKSKGADRISKALKQQSSHDYMSMME